MACPAGWAVWDVPPAPTASAGAANPRRSRLPGRSRNGMRAAALAVTLPPSRCMQSSRCTRSCRCRPALVSVRQQLLLTSEAATSWLSRPSRCALKSTLRGTRAHHTQHAQHAWHVAKTAKWAGIPLHQPPAPRAARQALRPCKVLHRVARAPLLLPATCPAHSSTAGVGCSASTCSLHFNHRAARCRWAPAGLKFLVAGNQHALQFLWHPPKCGDADDVQRHLLEHLTDVDPCRQRWAAQQATAGSACSRGAGCSLDGLPEGCRSLLAQRRPPQHGGGCQGAQAAPALAFPGARHRLQPGHQLVDAAMHHGCVGREGGRVEERLAGGADAQPVAAAVAGTGAAGRAGRAGTLSAEGASAMPRCMQPKGAS